MAVGWLKTVPREYRFAPRVDGKSIKLQAVVGQEDEAAINDVALVDQKVVAWDGTANKRLKDTGVTITEVGVLSGITPGTAIASKALVLNATKDIIGTRNFGVENINISGTLGVLGLSSLAATNVGGVLNMNGDINPVGLVKTNIRLDTAVKLQSRYNGTDYDVVSRSYSHVLFGNTSHDIYFRTNESNLLHYRGAVVSTVWDSYNDGSGGGLDADLLDGQHGAYYRDATNLDAGEISILRLPARLITRKVTFCFYSMGVPLGGVVADTYYDVYGHSEGGVKTINLMGYGARKKVLHVLGICETTLSGVTPTTFSMGLGIVGDTTKFLNATNINSAGEYQEAEEAPLDILSNYIYLTVTLVAPPPGGYNSITNGYWTFYITYLDYNY